MNVQRATIVRVGQVINLSGDANTKAIEENGKAVAEMVNLLRAKVIQ